jgi:uncharacterized protein YkwD
MLQCRKVLAAALWVPLCARPCPGGEDVQAAVSRVSALRAQARACGAAAPPLRWEPRLAVSARAYAEELARRDTLSHEGQQARSLRERLRAAGYRMRLGGENLAAGPSTLDEALSQWLLSPAHCENLMSADFEHMGLACAEAAGGVYGRYWVLHLGRALPELGPSTGPGH